MARAGGGVHGADVRAPVLAPHERESVALLAPYVVHQRPRVVVLRGGPDPDGEVFRRPLHEAPHVRAIVDVKLAELEAERQRALASVSQEADAHKMNKAMEMFEQVQAKKRERMQLQNEQEQQRLEQHAKGSQSTIAVLEEIAASSDDPAVKLEALKQLAELRKADVAGQKDAYKND